MKHFKDGTGREWNVTLNVSVVKRIRDLAGVDLLDTENCVAQIADNPIALADTLYAACKPQADERKVSDEQFGELLAGDVIADASNALLEELADFFPTGRRQILQRALGKMRAAETRMTAAAMAKLESPEVDQAIDAAIAKALGGPSTNSQASSESTPTP